MFTILLFIGAYLLCIGCGLMSGFGLTYGVIDEAGVSGGVGFPGIGLC